ncbi:MAG: right-handed parallel beta-helix repeat-containing protein, partial [Candidatus Thermoplasmatota archaeon]|nr:right-handed parallel beta-helix repeat-containing protein [Candidatus Thermoplasmatota archaeon]
MRKLKFAGIVLLISIMILSVLGSVVNIEVEAEAVGKSTSSWLMPHEPIYIGGNDDFTEENGVVGGSGTESDPYVIEGWNIDASATDGIRIKNTDVYFIIRNCIIRDSYDPGSETYKTGISFYLVQNGKIENVTSYNHYNGILLSSSSGNNITNCDFYDRAYGIYTYSSSNNNITSCCVYNNVYGVKLWSSSNNNRITNCYAYNNSYYGIFLHSSSNNNVTN